MQEKLIECDQTQKQFQASCLYCALALSFCSVYERFYFKETEESRSEIGFTVVAL